MVLSMTGFGTGVAEGEKRVTIEMKSVNHRYLDLFIRMPKGYLMLEDVVRREVSQRLHRGRIEVFVSIEDFEDKPRNVKIDWGLVRGYEAALRELERALHISYRAEGEHIIRQPDVLVAEEVGADVVEPLLKEALQKAIDSLISMRIAEGGNLAGDLRQRIQVLRNMSSEIRARVPQVVESYKDKLSQRIAELLQGVVVDEERLAMEVALFADRSNITEEIVRIGSHLDQFSLILEQDEPIGRKLDFLVQELQREFNTIASKASDAEISQMVVEAKAELEKIREQVQNIE